MAKINWKSKVESDAEALNKAKLEKLDELNTACEETILGRFKTTLDGVEYEFSFDDKAQSRFNGAPTTYVYGIQNEIEWTCYIDGVRTSIFLDEEKFKIVAREAYNHQDKNIKKFRQKHAQWLSAQSIPELEAIKWED